MQLKTSYRRSFWAAAIMMGIFWVILFNVSMIQHASRLYVYEEAHGVWQKSVNDNQLQRQFWTAVQQEDYTNLPSEYYPLAKTARTFLESNGNAAMTTDRLVLTTLTKLPEIYPGYSDPSFLREVFDSDIRMIREGKDIAAQVNPDPPEPKQSDLVPSFSQILLSSNKLISWSLCALLTAMLAGSLEKKWCRWRLYSLYDHSCRSKVDDYEHGLRQERLDLRLRWGLPFSLVTLPFGPLVIAADYKNDVRLWITEKRGNLFTMVYVWVATYRHPYANEIKRARLLVKTLEKNGATLGKINAARSHVAQWIALGQVKNAPRVTRTEQQERALAQALDDLDEQKMRIATAREVSQLP